MIKFAPSARKTITLLPAEGPKHFKHFDSLEKVVRAWYPNELGPF